MGLALATIARCPQICYNPTVKPIAAIILAAGGSTRLGQPKQLLDWDGQPLLAHVAQVVLASQARPVLAVLGCRAEEIGQALAHLPLQIVPNPDWAAGLSTSLRAGLSALPDDAAGALLILADQPRLTPALLDELIARFRAGPAQVVAPFYRGRRGTPVLFSRALFPALRRVGGDQGGRDLIARHADRLARVEVDDPSLFHDIDTHQDYRTLLSQDCPSAMNDLTRLEGLTHLIVDMDGVLWRGLTPQPGLGDFFDLLARRGIPFLLATNNASKTPQAYVERMAGYGVSIRPEQLMTSAQATALYLAEQSPGGGPVFVIGEEGLRQALNEQGFQVWTDPGTFEGLATPREADYVVVGWDRELNWRKLARATLLVRAGAGLVGTNPDPSWPSEFGLLPGNGATLAALEAATGVEPVVVGKPSERMFQLALKRLGAEPEHSAMVGDRLTTDVLGGGRAGLTTILLLSGVTDRATLAQSSIRPDLVFDDLADLTRAWDGLSGPPQGV